MTSRSKKAGLSVAAAATLLATAVFAQDPGARPPSTKGKASAPTAPTPIAKPEIDPGQVSAGTATTPPPAEGGEYQAVIAAWPERSRSVARAMVDKYGAPDEATARMVVWRGNGPWTYTIVHRDEVRHDFPKPHGDLLEQAVGFRVPAGKLDDLAKYQGSVLVDRTAGELAARCDDERMNILSLNLAVDVVTGKKDPAEARRAHAEAVVALGKNRKPPKLTERLQFEPTLDAADPDEPYKLSASARK